MATPEFVSTEQGLDEVRYYTPLDPYYYAVDNRPLQDLGGNSETIVKGTDAARRATLIQALTASSVLSGLFGSVSSDFVLGLGLTNPVTGTLVLGRGAILLPQALNSTDARVVTKVAALPVDYSLVAPHPVTAGKEVKFLVQIRYKDLSGSSDFPYYDVTNALLPSTLINGEIEVGLVTGTEANTGSASAPPATSGWTPLFVVTAVNGSPTATIERHSSAPKVLGLYTTDNVADAAWLAPSFANSWTNTGGAYSTAGYRAVLGSVQLRGVIGGGTISTSCFTLPVGYRPTHTKVFPVSSNGAFGSVTITAAGVVTPTAGATTVVSLDGISFSLT